MQGLICFKVYYLHRQVPVELFFFFFGYLLELQDSSLVSTEDILMKEDVLTLSTIILESDLKINYYFGLNSPLCETFPCASFSVAFKDWTTSALRLQ